MAKCTVSQNTVFGGATVISYAGGISTPITGLAPNTTYRYRAIASSLAG